MTASIVDSAYVYFKGDQTCHMYNTYLKGNEIHYFLSNINTSNDLKKRIDTYLYQK